LTNLKSSKTATELPTELSTSRNPLISVAVDAPLAPTLDYVQSGEPVAHGDWVCVPFGRKKVLGLVIDAQQFKKNAMGLGEPDPQIPSEKIKPIDHAIAAFPRADPAWIELMAFAARYYRRPFGTVAVGLVPKWLRDLKNFVAKKEGGRSSFDRLFTPLRGPFTSGPSQVSDATSVITSESGGRSLEGNALCANPLNPDQRHALQSIQSPGVHVLHGVTGSGKTRVYTEAARHVLEQNPTAQVLVMVPEIGLTPQLVGRFQEALPNISIAVLHSEVSERERARLWLSAATGEAQLIIGTRLAIMTPLPKLQLIMIDEEHDHSYKQQEGMRYSARDLAVWRAQQLGIPLVLGSATPSIETWGQIARNKYQRHSLPVRATGEPPAPIRLIDTLKDPAKEGLSAQTRQAMAQVLADKGQVLVFLNRRGYAPVLMCTSCGWSSKCGECSVPTVLHRSVVPVVASEAARKSNWRLQCHHCGLFAPVPRQCPDCGDTDLQPVGRGVQRLEQTLQEEFPSARVLRIDRDNVKQGKALQAALARIERGEADIVVGTQMLAKGHDFARMRLVVVADADTQLLNPDFRAPERLFATLIQVAGRAGRHEQSGIPAQVLVQTRYPQHPLYQFLLAQDVQGFARKEMADRQAAGLPPFSFMAAIRASHADARKAQSALRLLRDELQELAKEQGWAVSVYGPVARYPETQAGRWRGQLLLESASRPQLHHLLGTAEAWMKAARTMDPHVDVDPYEV
jgi:primosomal protein N' (replication factor Y) (superfamily II helicase)